MSEFKFACPVCGQHMMCDTSHGGSVMECPTCYQKIVAPQAPAPDAKFILTGTQLSEKKILVRGAETAGVAPKKNSPVATIFLFILVILLAAGVGAYFFRDKLFHQQLNWTALDIGNVSVPGTFSQSGGTLTITGSGADIWSQADAFHYVFVKVTGDGTITTRVADIKNTDAWAKAGVMFRDSLNADSKFVMAVVTPSSGISLQQRNDAGSPASLVMVAPAVRTPCWLRLQRRGEMFTADSSTDGSTWTSMGSTKVSITSHAYAGLVVCAHHDGSLCEAKFDHVTVTGFVEAAPAAALAPASKPVLIPPTASDTNWMLELGTDEIPDSPAAGRIHGQDFIVNRANFQNGTLTLRAGTRGPVEFGLTINFSGARAESLAGQSINVTTNADKAARVTLRWKEGDQVKKDSINNGYAMRLEFGPLANHQLKGKIHLCIPDAEKSYVLGAFTAEARDPKPKPPTGQ